MNKQQADRLIVEYLPKIYGFAMKKTFSYQEAEELSSDIVEEVYLSMLSAGEIFNLDGYVWRISDLPEPVVPATRPCGPWYFSCTSR